VKLAIALDRVVSLKDVIRHPVLADLAALIDGSTDGDDRSLTLATRPTS
jgi:hypothetical protein